MHKFYLIVLMLFSLNITQAQDSGSLVVQDKEMLSLYHLAREKQDGVIMIDIAEKYLERYFGGSARVSEDDVVQAYSWSLVAQQYLEGKDNLLERNQANIETMESIMFKKDLDHAQTELAMQIKLFIIGREPLLY